MPRFAAALIVSLFVWLLVCLFVCIHFGSRCAFQTETDPVNLADLTMDNALWDSPILRDLVIRFCPTSPSMQFNQIAVANRMWNISWRREWYPLCKDYLRTGIRENNLLLLHDLEDIF